MQGYNPTPGLQTGSPGIPLSPVKSLFSAASTAVLHCGLFCLVFKIRTDSYCTQKRILKELIYGASVFVCPGEMNPQWGTEDA